MRPSALLISMPWGSLNEPSLGLGVLAAALRQRGYEVVVRHLHLWLLDYMRPDSYKVLADLYALNDFVFSRDLDPDGPTDHQLALIHKLTNDRFDRIDYGFRRTLDPAPHVDQYLRLRNELIPTFLDDCMREVRKHEFSFVGFTCMYDQTLPSVALARRIRQEYPGALIVLGGTAVLPPTAQTILRSFPWLDAVNLGDGEWTIDRLVDASVNRSLLPGVPGIIYRSGPEQAADIVVTPGARSSGPMDGVPWPDYSDWMADIDELYKQTKVRITPVALPLETSRGCWWGQRNHCTFCGIDEVSMQYRRRSPEFVAPQLESLSDQYGVTNFRFSDYIMPREYFRTLLPELGRRDSPFRLHWEMKSNMTVEEADILQRGGVFRAQLGVESFSTPVLKMMRKGVNGLQNITAIRMLAERDTEVYYNFLYGFPEDDAEYYRRMWDLIPRLSHFPPPETFLAILFSRFSPLSLSWASKGPLHAHYRYGIIFSEAFLQRTGFSLDDYCYVFQRPYDVADDVRSACDVLVYQIAHWRREWDEGNRKSCTLQYNDSAKVVRDSRFGSEEHYPLTHDESVVLGR